MSYTVEQLAVDAARNKVNVELLYDPNTADPAPFGVRLRFYGKNAPSNKMVWGVGEDYDAAAYDAVMNLKRKNFITLDWAYRPWDQGRDDEAIEWMV